MRLPDTIEREIRAIEAEYDARPGQHAGLAKLRGLRWAIEDFLKCVGWSYSGSPQVEAIGWSEKREKSG